MHILLHQDAGSDDITKSILHSLKFHDLLNKSKITKESDWSNYMYSLEESLQWTHDNYSKFTAELDDKNWQSDTIYWNDT
jgi:hypothetical protein